MIAALYFIIACIGAAAATLQVWIICFEAVTGRSWNDGGSLIANGPLGFAVAGLIFGCTFVCALIGAAVLVGKLSVQVAP